MHTPCCADKLRSEAAAAVGNKLARRKHQIGTLLANAKLRELELLEKSSQVGPTGPGQAVHACKIMAYDCQQACVGDCHHPHMAVACRHR